MDGLDRLVCRGCGKVLEGGRRVRLSVLEDSGGEVLEFRSWYCCHACMGHDLFQHNAPQTATGLCASDCCLVP